jgi:hypothetical protein
MKSRELGACNVLLDLSPVCSGYILEFCCDLRAFRAKYPAAPLGLITVAALLPSTWSMRDRLS